MKQSRGAAPNVPRNRFRPGSGTSSVPCDARIGGPLMRTCSGLDYVGQHVRTGSIPFCSGRPFFGAPTGTLTAITRTGTSRPEKDPRTPCWATRRVPGLRGLWPSKKTDECALRGKSSRFHVSNLSCTSLVHSSLLLPQIGFCFRRSIIDSLYRS